MVEPKSPESFSDTELFTSGMAVSSNRDATRLYLWFNQFEESCRFQTQREFLQDLSLWQRGFWLLSSPFLPGTAHDFSNDAQTTDDWLNYFAQEFRMLLLAEGVRASKHALDAFMNGYYSQCLSVCRVILESWKRIAFVRRELKGVFRFVPKQEWIPEQIRQLWEVVPSSQEPDSKDWNRVFPGCTDLKSRDGLDRLLLDKAQDQISYLHDHAHPTMETVTQLMNPNDELLDRHHLLIHPVFSMSHAMSCSHVTLFCLSYLLYEVQLLFPMSSAWQTEHSRWCKEYVAIRAKSIADRSISQAGNDGA